MATLNTDYTWFVIVA